jgi:CDP-L-myo-inositol myo-inositolphosphotransferase
VIHALDFCCASSLQAGKKPMLQELKDIKALQKRPDGIFGSFMTRPVSHIVAFFAFMTGMTPNLVSFFSFIFCCAGVSLLFLFPEDYRGWLAGGALWWLGAIFDAADGDLARYAKKGTPFGGWFDSFLDRMKEFLIFGAFGYLAFKRHENELFLLLGFASMFSNVISGWISDTKKLFIAQRAPEVQFSKKYSFGMVDTRDFFVVLSIALFDMRVALWTYGTVFMLLLAGQALMFVRKYGNVKSSSN